MQQLSLPSLCLLKRVFILEQMEQKIQFLIVWRDKMSSFEGYCLKPDYFTGVNGWKDSGSNDQWLIKIGQIQLRISKLPKLGLAKSAVLHCTHRLYTSTVTSRMVLFRFCAKRRKPDSR